MVTAFAINAAILQKLRLIRPVGLILAVSMACALWPLSTSAQSDPSPTFRTPVPTVNLPSEGASSSDSQPYNIKLGQALAKFSGRLDTRYTDNATFSENNRQDDIFITPGVDMSLTWPMTEFNTLRINTGFAYRFAINDTETAGNGFLINPDSMIDFDMFVGDFRFNFYDRFSYEIDPIEESTVSGTGDFGRFINTAGIDIFWNLNQIELMVGYAHTDWISTSSSFEFLDRRTETVHGRATFILGPKTSAGVMASTSLNIYDRDFQNDSTRVSVGPFLSTKITDNLNLLARASFELGLFDSGNLNGDNQDLSTYNVSVTLNHDLNRYLAHSLETGRVTNLGTTSNFYDTIFVRHRAAWKIMRDVTLNSHGFVEFSDESASTSSDQFTRWGVGCSASYQITEKLSSTLGYNFIEKDSGRIDRSYYQNNVTLGFRYDF